MGPHSSDLPNLLGFWLANGCFNAPFLEFLGYLLDFTFHSLLLPPTGLDHLWREVVFWGFLFGLGFQIQICIWVVAHDVLPICRLTATR